MNPKRLAILRDEREMLKRMRENSMKGRNTDMYRDTNKSMLLEEIS